MVLKKWEDLPERMRTDAVKKYYEILQKKKISLFLKRLFDVSAAVFLLIVLLPVFLALAVAIKMDSNGPVFYRQVRVTQYGRKFRIHKFRSMVEKADRKGTLVTVDEDNRITKVGRLIRRKRLDELPQLIDVLQGNMTFVGVRPEVPEYVKRYTPEMMATLLLPAGITSLASVYYQNEAELLKKTEDAERIYLDRILPEKMKLNLKEIKEYGFWKDIGIMFMTVFSVFGRRNEAGSKKNEHITD